jgi:hypothetical protein
VISGFRRDVDEICVLLGRYAASSGNPLPTFRHNVSLPSSRVKNSNALDFLPLADGTDMLSRNVGKDYHSTLRNTPEERRSQEQN